MPELIVKLGDKIDRKYFFVTESMQIGRGPENQIVIENLAVSRAHAIIKHREGSYTIEDLGSSNGTFVNGVRVKKTELMDKDVILIGKHQLYFYNQQPAAEPPPRPVPVDIEGTILMSEEAAPVAQKARLEVVKGRHKGERFDLSAPSLTIGSGQQADVRITDWFVSRTHAVVERRGPKYVLVDQRAWRHTFVNNEQVEEAQLADGDVIQLGSMAQLRFKLVGQLAEVRASLRVPVEMGEGSGIHRSEDLSPSAGGGDMPPTGEFHPAGVAERFEQAEQGSSAEPAFDADARDDEPPDELFEPVDIDDRAPAHVEGNGSAHPSQSADREDVPDADEVAAIAEEVAASELAGADDRAEDDEAPWERGPAAFTANESFQLSDEAIQEINGERPRAATARAVETAEEEAEEEAITDEGHTLADGLAGLGVGGEVATAAREDSIPAEAATQDAADEQQPEAWSDEDATPETPEQIVIDEQADAAMGDDPGVAFSEEDGAAGAEVIELEEAHGAEAEADLVFNGEAPIVETNGEAAGDEVEIEEPVGEVPAWVEAPGEDDAQADLEQVAEDLEVIAGPVGETAEAPADESTDGAASEAGGRDEIDPELQREVAIWERALNNKSEIIRRQAARKLKQLTGRDYDY